MLRLLQWLFIGHVHKWTTVRAVEIGDGNAVHGSRWIQQCDGCGIVKKRDLI